MSRFFSRFYKKKQIVTTLMRKKIKYFPLDFIKKKQILPTLMRKKKKKKVAYESCIVDAI